MRSYLAKIVAIGVSMAMINTAESKDYCDGYKNRAYKLYCDS